MLKKNILNPLGFEPRIQGYRKYFLNQGLACFRLQHGFFFFSGCIVGNRPNPYNKFKNKEKMIITCGAKCID